MATLENIRKRGPLVAIIIGFAMLAFILGDFLNSGTNLLSGDRFRIAQVGDVSVDYRDYEQRVKDAIEQFKQQYQTGSIDDRQREEIRRQVWEGMIQEIILQKEYDELGLDVSGDELFDMVQGRNVDPLIQQIPAFRNPQTGMFDPAMVIYFLKNMDKDPNSKAAWLNIEEQIKQKRLSSKYINLIIKGLYVTKAQAETAYKERNYLVDFNYVAKRYSEVSDSSISISESDLKAYYKEHKNDFKQEESRDIAYVTFDVVPSVNDTAYTLDWIQKAKPEFAAEENIKQYVNFNSDIPFDEKHYKKGEIANFELDSFMFSNEPGAVFGPYFEDGAYKLARIVEKKEMPDSIGIKHILIQINGKDIPDIERAKAVADSLKSVIEKGADFAEIVKNFSSDQTSLDKGGNLGMFAEGQRAFGIFPYKEMLDEKTNSIKNVETQYGVHILVKTSQTELVPKVQIAVLARNIVPSSDTYQSVYAEASKFAGENRNLKDFDKAIQKNGLLKKIAPRLSKNETFIAGLSSPREMIRWAFNAELGDVSQVYEFGNRYVVAALTAIREEGTAPFEQVKEEIRFFVAKEKKAEYLKNELAKLMPTDLNSAASKLNTTIGEARNVSFSSNQIEGLGFEPVLIADVVSAEKNKVEGPVKGNNGVYLYEVTIITSALNLDKVDLKPEINKLQSDLQQRAIFQVVNALKESTEIVDERSKFY
jgi:peptidyl-prolyl cis-trans isomerase D